MPASPSADGTRKIKVLIVDDSASVRMTLSEIISSDPELEVMATAADPYVAVERIKQQVPDVIFLDIELPRMDGVTFLRKLMAQRPIPVVICSSVAESGSETLMQAMEAGAVDVVTKPRVDTAQFLQDSAMRICDAAKAAAHAKLKGPPKAPPPRINVEAKLTAEAVIPQLSAARRAALLVNMPVTDPVIAIGASTGGTEALRELLEALPPTAPASIACIRVSEPLSATLEQMTTGIGRCAISLRRKVPPSMRGSSMSRKMTSGTCCLMRSTAT